jgi:hypothetical protein
MKSLVLVTGVVFAAHWSPAAAASGRTDADLFNEARIAIDKFHDCPAAGKALNEISGEGKRDPIWIFYAAKANECAGNLSASLAYYREYDKRNPGQREILDKIGELEYKLRKQNDETRGEQQKAAALAAKEQEARDALAKALNKFAGTWRHEEANTSARYNDYCAARRDSTRRLRIDQFAVGEIKTTGTYRIDSTVRSDGSASSSSCNEFNDVNMRRDSWHQERDFDVAVICDRDLSCKASMSMTNCFGDGCRYLRSDEKYYSARITIVGSRLSFDVRTGTYLMSQ